MSLSSQTSVIAANRGLPSFCFAFDCLWSLDISGSKWQKVTWASQRLAKLFESNLGIASEKICYDVKIFI